MKKKIIPIAFCFDKKFELQFKVAIYSLFKNKNDNIFYEINIIHSDLDNDTIKRISIFNEKFNKISSINFVKIDEKIFEKYNLPKKNNSYAFYYRILIPYILPNYKKIIYSDADVLFLDDLEDMFDIDIENFYFGVIQFNHEKYFTTDFDFNNKYFASGNMILNNELLKKQNILLDFEKIANKYAKKLLHHDQDCLNALFYKKVKYVDLRYCVNYKLYNQTAIKRYLNIHLTNYTQDKIEQALDNPCIIHFTGRKPDTQYPSPEIWIDYCEEAGLLNDYLENLYNSITKNYSNFAELNARPNNKKNIMPKSFDKKLLKSCGKNVIIENSVTITDPQNVDLGSNIYIGSHTRIAGRGGVKIMDNVVISSNVDIHSSNHNYLNAQMIPYDDTVILKKVTIGEGVWIGTKSLITPGSSIGPGCIIGMGSVVAKDCEPFCVYGGNPACIIKKRQDQLNFFMNKKNKMFYIDKKLKNEIQYKEIRKK